MSNLVYTKAKEAQPAKAALARGSGVFPQHNKSPIGQTSTQIEGAISKAKTQFRPGKAIKDKKDLKFCPDCGKYVGGEVYTL